MVDLRDNLLDCKGFPAKTILGVITDCEITEAVSVKTTKTLKVTRTLVLMPVLIVCLRGVGKMFKLKRTRTLPISRELSLFNFDVDSEEHVVIDVTAS